MMFDNFKGSGVILGVIFASLVAVVFTSFHGDLFDKYSVTYDETALEEMNKLSIIEDLIKVLGDKVQTVKDSDLLQIALAVPLGLIEGVILSFSALDSYLSVVTNGFSIFGLPTIFSIVFMAVASYLFFRWAMELFGKSKGGV